MKNLKSILLAAALLAVGIIFTLNALGFPRVDIFFDGWWTLFVIVPCLWDFLTKKKNGAATGIIIGFALLLSEQGLI